MVAIAHHNPRDYERWLARLSPLDRARILDKLLLLALVGTELTMPNVRRLSGGMSELRVDKFRLYFVIEADTALLLTYGSKDTQQRDIARARRRR